MSSDETRDMSLAFSTTGQFLWWYFYHGAVTFVAFIECDVLKALKIIILSLQKNFYIRLWLTSGDGTTLCLHQEVNWIESSPALGSWDKWAEGVGVEEGTLSLPLYRLSECFMFMYVCLWCCTCAHVFIFVHSYVDEHVYTWTYKGQKLISLRVVLDHNPAYLLR